MRHAHSLRILLITHGLPPESVGGVEQHVDGLARSLATRGHHVHVYAKTGRSDFDQGTTIDEPADEARPYGVTRVVWRYEGLTDLRSLYAVPLLDAALERFLDSRAPFDVAHLHHLTGMSTGLVQRIRRRGVGTVMTLHDYWMLCPRGQMWHREGRVCARVEPSTCANCLRPNFGGFVPPGAAGDAVLADHHRYAREVLLDVDRLVVPSAAAIPPFVTAGIPIERVAVVPNGVDVARLRALSPAARTAGERIRFGYLGTLIPSKGLDVLVRAWQGLPAGTSELHAFGNVVPYHGDFGFLTRALAGLRPQDRFTYHGPYTTDDLPRILSTIDVLVAPALWAEAFGLTVREALAAGRGVLVSKIGGLADAIEDGVAGRVLPAGDVTALRQAMAAVLADPGLVARWGTAARSAPAVRDFAAMADHLLEVYRDLLRA
jgi:glycosyltransferase involved in cell wall biosynthesis